MISQLPIDSDSLNSTQLSSRFRPSIRISRLSDQHCVRQSIANISTSQSPQRRNILGASDSSTIGSLQRCSLLNIGVAAFPRRTDGHSIQHSTVFNIASFSASTFFSVTPSSAITHEMLGAVAHRDRQKPSYSHCQHTKAVRVYSLSRKWSCTLVLDG
jgi:hypothetical protein